MKTLKLSSMLLVCLVLLFSCTKDTSITNEQDSLNTEYRYGVTGQGGQGNNISVAEVVPTLGIEFSSSPAVVGQPVTATAKFTPAVGETIPTCGKLQLQMWLNGVWSNVGQINVSAILNEVSYTFTPTIVGENAYKFKVHYVAQNCAGYKPNMTPEIFLSVINSCSFGITGEIIESFIPTPGIRQFTVKYKVQTCALQFDKFKLQGGLTNGSTYVSSTETEHHTPGTSSNQIVKWEYSTPGVPLTNGEKTFLVTFKKAYSGSGPMTITGSWSASLSMNGVSVGNVEFAPIVFNP